MTTPRKFLWVLIFLISCTPGTKFTLHEANDIFKLSKNNDRNFSQGAKFALEVPDETGSTSYFVGNNFYTPGNKQLATPQPDDRPYAGYTYGGADWKYRRTATVQEVIGATIGMVGPHSYSEQFQNQVHRWLDQNPARGWDNQLEDEVGIILKAERSNNFILQAGNFDLTTTYGGHLGNVFTQGYGGANFRYGRNLPDPFLSPGVIFPRLPDSDELSDWSYYLHGGPFVRAVAQNIFLDGNTFVDSLSVDKKPFVFEGRLGFAVEYSRYRFSYTYFYVTDEFKEQTVPNDFGEITISYGW